MGHGRSNLFHALTINVWSMYQLTNTWSTFNTSVPPERFSLAPVVVSCERHLTGQRVSLETYPSIEGYDRGKCHILVCAQASQDCS